MDSVNPLLALEGVTVTYAEPGGDAPIRIFANLSLSVTRGQVVVIAGRSGSGKTTLLNCAAGLLKPSEGDVLWDGESIGRLSPRERDRRRAGFIGYLFQDAGLVDMLTALENVALPGVPNRALRNGARARDLLAEFGLAARGRHYPDQLSGGEQKRVAIARALYADPPVLVLDEPTANADKRTSDEIIIHLRRVANEGHGLLVASHDSALIDMSDSVVALEDEAAFRS